MHLLSKIRPYFRPTTTWSLIRSKYQPNANPNPTRLSRFVPLFFTIYLILLSCRVIGGALLCHPTAVHRLSPTLMNILSSDATLSLLLSGFEASLSISLSFSLLPLYCLAIHYWILCRPLPDIWRDQYAYIIANAEDFWASNRPQVMPLTLDLKLGPIGALADALTQLSSLWNCQVAIFTTSFPSIPNASVRGRIRAILLSWALEKIVEPALAVVFGISEIPPPPLRERSTKGPSLTFPKIFSNSLLYLGIALMTQSIVYLVPFALKHSALHVLLLGLDGLLITQSILKTFQLLGILNHMGDVSMYISLATLREQGRLLEKTLIWLRQTATAAAASPSSSGTNASSAHARRIPMSFLSARLAQYRLNQTVLHRGVLLYNEQLVSVFMLLTLLAIAPVSIAFSSMLLIGDLPHDKVFIAVLFQVTHIVAIFGAVTMFNLICRILYSGQASLYTIQSFIRGHFGEKWRLLRHYEALNTKDKLAFTVGGFGETINRRTFFFFCLEYYSFILYLSKLLIAKHSTANL